MFNNLKGHARWLPIGVLCLIFAFLIYNAGAQSPTMDEQNHIARGYALLRTGDPRLSLEHPPFINVLEALPLLLLRDTPQLPLDDKSWEQGYWYGFADVFLWQGNQQPDHTVFLARLPVIAMTLLLAALAARWARELWGTFASIVTLIFVGCDPNILAHGSLATTDLGITFTAFLVGYAMWRLRDTLNLQRILLSGLAMGAMLASKTSAPLFWGVFGLLFVVDAVGTKNSNGWRKVWTRGLVYLNITIIALLFLWASYAFQIAPVMESGPALPMGIYWKGILTVFRNVQGGQPAYLLGETTLGGTWRYFPIAFVVKTPLPSLVLLLITIPIAIRRKHWRASLFLLLPVTLYWFFAMRSTLNLGYRHLLPTLPFLYVWMAQVGAGVELGTKSMLALSKNRVRILLCGLSAWLIISTLWIAPHFIAYFNPIGGGPEHGWRIIADSNIDWGQDLEYLRDYISRNQLSSIKLSWFGSAPPAAYGIDYEPLPGLPHHFNMWFEPPTFNEQQPEPGIYAISVSNLVELPLDAKHFFNYFRAREPDARIGYSIYIYKIKP